MSYQPGKMGMASGMALVYFATVAPVFLSVFPNYVELAFSAAWAVPLLNGLWFIGIVYILLYVQQTIGGKGGLFTACEKLLGTVLTRLIILYYISVYFIDAAFLLRQYAENTLITALPNLNFEMAILLYVFISVLLNYAGVEAIARGSYALLPWVVGGIFLVLALVSPNFQVLFLAPWDGPGWGKVLLTGIVIGGVNFGGLIPFILADSLQNGNTVKKAAIYGTILSTLTRVAVNLGFILCFGVAVSREKILPYYEMARLVYINRFIQRIEAYFAIVWVMMGLFNISIDICIGLYLLSQLFDMPTYRPFIVPTAIIIAEFSMIPPNVMTVIRLYQVAFGSLYDIGTLLIPLVLLAAAIYQRRQGRCSAS